MKENINTCSCWISFIDWKLCFSVGLPAVVAVLSWFLIDKLSSKRELNNRKSEARIKALETAYLRLALSSNRELTDPLMDDIERFVAEIQLYGTPDQIKLMGKMVEEFKKPNNPVSFDELLSNLRDGLRSELNLEKISGNVWWFRFKRPKKEPT